MLSKLWRAWESPGELVKNTDALTPIYRLGLSRSVGPEVYVFLTSSQVTLRSSRLENLWHSSRHECSLSKNKFQRLSTSYPSLSVFTAWHTFTPSLPFNPLYSTSTGTASHAESWLLTSSHAGFSLPCLLTSSSWFLCALGVLPYSLSADTGRWGTWRQKDHLGGDNALLYTLEWKSNAQGRDIYIDTK